MELNFSFVVRAEFGGGRWSLVPARAGWFWVVQTLAQVTGALPLPGMKFPTSLFFFLHLLNQLYLDPGAFWDALGMVLREQLCGCLAAAWGQPTTPKTVLIQ